MKNKQLKKTNQQKNPVTKTSRTISQHKNRSYYDLLAVALIIILGIIIYSNSFNCSFHFDDGNSIVDNASIRNLSDVKAWWNYSSSRPLAYFTFALNYHFGKLDVWGYHLVNLMIHLATSIIVWWLTLLIFSTPVMKDKDISKHKKMIALFTALLFVSHPLATQSVTYIVQRMASMVAMFYLLSLAFYVKARIFDKKNLSKYMLFVGAIISAILAMLTKENAFTLPFSIVLVEIFFLQTSKRKISFRDYRMVIVIGAFLSLIILLFFKFPMNIFNPIQSLNNGYTVTPYNYLFTQFSVITKYIQLLFLPLNQNLDHDILISNSFLEARTFLSFLFLLSLIILGIYFFKRYRVISFGIFWFFLTLSIESGFIPIKDVIFEHRTYLPSFGFFLCLISGIYISLWRKYKYLAIALYLGIIVSNSLLTFERNKVWIDDFSLWNDAVVKAPNKARPFLNRSKAYADRGQRDNALADLSRAITINPNYALAYYNRGAIYGELEQWDKAISDYSNCIELNNLKKTDSYYNRGLAYIKKLKFENAINDFSNALKMNPQFTNAYNNRGISYFNLKQCENAIQDYTKAIELNPKHAKAYYNRGKAYGNLGQLDKAISDYTKAFGIDSKYIDAYFNCGNAYYALEQWDKAVNVYNKALEIDPNNAKISFNRDVAFSKLNKEKK